MVKKIRQALKNEKGLTLVELLAVVVILGIISAIAIPSIGGLINNSKKDAHIANAQQMVNSAKLMVTSQDIEFADGKATVLLSDLISKGYIEEMKNPSEGTYSGNSSVTITKNGNSHSYSVLLMEKTSGTKYIVDKDPFELKRGEVNL